MIMDLDLLLKILNKVCTYVMMKLNQCGAFFIYLKLATRTPNTTQTHTSDRHRNYLRKSHNDLSGLKYKLKKSNKVDVFC